MDEIDDCIVNYGSYFDEETNKCLGFWDVLKIPTIMLSATMNQNMEDLVYKLYGIPKSRFYEFKELQNTEVSVIPSCEISYHVFKDFEEVDNKVLETIEKYKDQKPIIVFCRMKTIIKLIMENIQHIHLPKVVLIEDKDLQHSKVVIKNFNRGILFALSDYVRGTDLRFLEDSHVIVNFLPNNMEEVIQATGRSSRTMNTHSATVICQDHLSDSDNIEQRLKAKSVDSLTEGIQIA